MIRAVVGLALAAAVLAVSGTAAAVPLRSPGATDPVVYLPACDDAAVIPAGSYRDPDCPRPGRVAPRSDCFSSSPGDFAAPPAPPVDPRRGTPPTPRTAPAPALPDRICLEVVPAGPPLTARP